MIFLKRIIRSTAPRQQEIRWKQSTIPYHRWLTTTAAWRHPLQAEEKQMFTGFLLPMLVPMIPFADRNILWLPYPATGPDYGISLHRCWNRYPLHIILQLK